MKISKGMIILGALVAFLVVTGVKVKNGTKALNKNILKNTVIVSDGKVDSANEGKLVLVAGKIAFDSKISFDELDEPLNTFKAKRTVREFYSYQKKGETHYDWKERTEQKAGASSGLDSLYSVEKTVTPHVGDFVLDAKGLELVKAGAEYTKQKTVCGLKHDEFYYGPITEVAKEGDLNLKYNYYDVEKYPYLSVLAEQRGNSFKPFKLGKTEVYYVFNGKVDSADALKGQLDENVKKIGSARSGFIIMVLLIGVGLIYSSRKNKAAKEKKEADAQ